MKRNHNKLKYINCGYKDCISGYNSFNFFNYNRNNLNKKGV